jgi:hypothetical protein
MEAEKEVKEAKSRRKEKREYISFLKSLETDEKGRAIDKANECGSSCCEGKPT